MLERRAKESRVRILKGEDDSLQGSASFFGNPHITENSSFKSGGNSHRGNSDGSSISNMIYASSRLFDEKRKKNFNESGVYNEGRNSGNGDSFMKIHPTQKSTKREV